MAGSGKVQAGQGQNPSRRMGRWWWWQSGSPRTRGAGRFARGGRRHLIQVGFDGGFGGGEGEGFAAVGGGDGGGAGELHEVVVAAVGGEGHAVGDALGEDGEVGGDVEIFLDAGVGDSEAGDDFVEDQDGVVAPGEERRAG